MNKHNVTVKFNDLEAIYTVDVLIGTQNEIDKFDQDNEINSQIFYCFTYEEAVNNFRNFEGEFKVLSVLD